MARKKTKTHDLPLGWTDMDGAMAMTTLGDTKVTELARGGQIDAKRHGRRILYGISSIEAFIDSLPPAYPVEQDKSDDIAA